MSLRKKEAIEKGYPKESETYFLISGNLNTLFIVRDHITIIHMDLLVKHRKVCSFHAFIFPIGMWGSSHFLGLWLGPTLGGVCVEIWNFRTTSVIYWCTYIVVLVSKKQLIILC